MFAYIARETEKAIAIVKAPVTGATKPLWVPRSKIVSMMECDCVSLSVQLAGENVRRLATPVEIEIDPEFLKKIGA